MTPDAKVRRASMFPGAGCRDCRHLRGLCKRHLRAVPLVQYFLDHVLVPVQPKANRPFVRRPTGIAIHFQLHLLFILLTHEANNLARSLDGRHAEPKQLTAAMTCHTSCPEKSMQSLDHDSRLFELTLRRSENEFCHRTPPCTAPTKPRLRCFPGWCAFHIRRKPWQSWA